ATVGDVLEYSIAHATNLVLDHDHVIRLDDDIEGVHQARVGTRRLRSNLRTFADAVEPSWATPLRKELKWLARTLGEVRDRDVRLIRLAEAIALLPKRRDRRAGGVIQQRLRDERDVALRRLLDAMRTERYLALLEQLVAAVQSPQLIAEVADRPADEVVTEK